MAAYIFVGLGNPGAEYEHTRHNAGRSILFDIADARDFTEWKHDATLRALSAKGELGGEKVTMLLPETFMNKSGQSVKPLIGSRKKAERLVVLYDDLDLPIGKIKISFGRGSGGHKGVESIARAIGTKEFVRVRIGIAQISPKGLPKKPKGEEKVLAYLMGKFSTKEGQELAKVARVIDEALGVLLSEGRPKAMTLYN